MPEQAKCITRLPRLLARIAAQQMMLDLAERHIAELHQELGLARELLAHDEDPPPPRKP